MTTGNGREPFAHHVRVDLHDGQWVAECYSCGVLTAQWAWPAALRVADRHVMREVCADEQRVRVR